MNRRVTLRIGVCAMLSTVSLGGSAAEGAAAAPGAAQVPPGYSLNGTGNRADFEFLAGAWTTQQRRLKKRGVGSVDWSDSPANVHCATRYLDGAFIAEESYSPTKTPSGLFVYTFDVAKRQWSLYWIDPKSGKLDAPLVGGFVNERGEFYGEDVEDGRPIKVRYSWVKRDADHARWEQAYSFDNTTWETNWISEFVRADPASHCVAKGQAPASR